MTPSVAATINVVFAVINAAPEDRGWGPEEAAPDWSGVAAAALEIIVAAGIIEHPAAETLTLWDMPFWRDSAVEYHRNRRGCLAVEIEPKRLAVLRGLMADDTSLERAWHDFRDSRTGIFR